MKLISAQNKQANRSQAFIYSPFSTVTLWLGWAVVREFVNCNSWKYPGLHSQKCTNQAYQLHGNYEINKLCVLNPRQSLDRSRNTKVN